MFKPEGFKEPVKQYLQKLDMGSTKLRFLSDPILFTEYWKDKKPHRFSEPLDPVSAEEYDEDKFGNTGTQYLAAIVYNYKVDAVQIYSLSQVSIINRLQELSESEDWGDVKNYDVTITKSEKSGRTIYSVDAVPPKPAPEVSIDHIDLKKLLTGENPFGDK
jgi:hypothetical protein